MFDIFWNIISAIIAMGVGIYIWHVLKSVKMDVYTNNSLIISLLSVVAAFVCYYSWFAFLIIYISIRVIMWLMQFGMECIELIHYVYFTPKYKSKKIRR